MQVDAESVGIEPDSHSQLIDHAVEVGQGRADVCVTMQDLTQMQQEGHVLVLPVFRQESFHRNQVGLIGLDDISQDTGVSHSYVFPLRPLVCLIENSNILWIATVNKMTVVYRYR